MKQATDEELMARVAGGDTAAFAELGQRLSGKATALAQRILLNRAEAEEIAQEALLRLWVKAPNWTQSADGGAARVTTWLWRVVVNLSIDRKRKPVHEDIDDAPEIADERPDAFAGIAQREIAQRVRAAVDALPERQRAVLALCHFQDMSNAQAAEILDLTVGAVESLLVRARRTLRLALADLRSGAEPC